jgi:hypothetical protein
VALNFLQLKADLTHGTKDEDITGKIMAIREVAEGVLVFSS